MIYVMQINVKGMKKQSCNNRNRGKWVRFFSGTNIAAAPSEIHHAMDADNKYERLEDTRCLTGQPIAYNLSKLISNKCRMEAMPEKTSKAMKALYNNELFIQDTLSSQIDIKVAIQNGIDKRPTRMSAAASPTTK